MRIYIGNLPYRTTNEELREAFEQYGEVVDTHVAMDRETNRSRGFGFVEMPDSAEGQAAIEAMNGKEWQGRTLKVSEARPREDSRRPNR